MIAVY